MNVVSLFSGAGGLDLGFKMAGHSIVWANDIYEDAVKTYKSNLSKHIIFQDILTIDEKSNP
jgi:DNA (cytosine-5)-methyltransferase 1